MSVWLRVNMSTRKVDMQKLPDKYRQLGGRALTSQICADEIDPICYPLGDQNKLIFAPGLLSQLDLSFGGRITVGAKSPLTRGIAAANGGGLTGKYLGENGIRAVVIEGLPKEDEMYVLTISDGNATLQNAADLKGKGTYETTRLLRQRYGASAAVACIGPVGEMLLESAAIANAGRNGVADRFCGRGGLGAVMGSKRLKAIVIADSQNKTQDLRDYVSRMQNSLDESQSMTFQQCLPQGLKTIALSPVKPGTQQAFATFCGINNNEMLAKINDLINDVGMDTLETAAALGVMMEADLISWGDGKRVYEYLLEAAEGTSMGRILASGATLAAEALAITEFKHLSRNLAQSQALLPNDNSYLAGEKNDSTFCVTAALQSSGDWAFIPAAFSQADIAGDLQAVTHCLLDSIGFCLYSAPAFWGKTQPWPHLISLLQAAHGWKITADELIQVSRKTLQAEQQFNRSAGYDGKHNRLGGLHQDFWRPRHDHFIPMVPGITESYLQQ